MSLVSIQEHVYDQTKKKAEHKGNWTSKQIENLCKFLKLSLAEEKLLAVIDNLDNDAPFYCYASNKYLAEMLRLSESRVSFYITKLKRKGLIEQVEREGRRRTLRCLRENWIVDSKKELCVKTSTSPASIHDPELRESAIHIIKDNTKEDSIETTTPLPPKKEAMNPINERPSVVVVLKNPEDKPKKPAITKDDVHFYCVKARKDWTPEEIESAWEAYKDSTSSISDTYAYISGIIDKKRILAQNQRNKARHTREKPCSKTSTQISKKESQNTKTTSTAGGFSEQQLAELLGPNRAFKRSSSS